MSNYALKTDFTYSDVTFYYEGATYFAIGMALVRIVGTILQDQHSVLPISELLNGEYGQTNVCLGKPCIMGQGGAEQIVEAQLTDEEREYLEKSARILQNALTALGE